MNLTINDHFDIPAEENLIKVKINENGEVSDVCVGTNEMHGADAYLQRERITGDFHGQAPVLWCANALLR